MFKCTVLSEPTPQKGQNHRSSNNFTTADAPDGAALFVSAFYDYETPNQKEAKDIVFDVWADKTGLDPHIWDGIKDGDTVTNQTHHRNLYIANPKGATKSFTVEFTHR